MITINELDRIAGAPVYGTDDQQIGSVAQVYLDNESGQPEWITVRTGLFGTKESFVPLAQAQWAGDRLRVPYDKNMIKEAPRIDADADINPQEERELYSYYGTSREQMRSNAGNDRYDAGGRGPANMATRSGVRSGVADAEGRESGLGDDDNAMTRSEERLTAGTQSREVGKVRLRKHIVTEQQQVTVPVSHEEVRVEREPITEANRDRAMAGPDLAEGDVEVTLHAEQAVVTTETVPVERVRLDTETVTEQETVRADVRKEQIEVEGDEVVPDTLDDDLRQQR